MQDITAEKRAEREKARLEERLRQAQKMESIGSLAGGIAHDFNNMLAVIIGNAEMALDDLNRDTGPSRNIEQIMEASKRAADLVKQILTFSRKTETGRNPIKLSPSSRRHSDFFAAHFRVPYGWTLTFRRKWTPWLPTVSNAAGSYEPRHECSPCHVEWRRPHELGSQCYLE